MLRKKISEKDIEKLFEVVLELNNKNDCKALFSDLCTDKEIEQMAQRIKAAKLLIDGKTYNEVIAETDISSATLSRVSRCVQYGKGYSKFIK